MRLSYRISFLVVACLLLVGGASYVLFYMGRDKSDIPGTDVSHLQASAIPDHLEAMKSQDASVRKKAASILWQMGVEAKEATPTLLLVAKDPDPQVREAAVKALGRTGQGTQDAIPAFLEALKDDETNVRAAAATSLAE